MTSALSEYLPRPGETKDNIAQMNAVRQSSLGSRKEEVYRPEVDTSSVNERKLMRRIDWHVVPVSRSAMEWITPQLLKLCFLQWLAMLYLLKCDTLFKLYVTFAHVSGLISFLDRGSIGNAKLYHLEQDLHITDQQYLIALTVFFFPYALFEVKHCLGRLVLMLI
jgi:hypothetical protein